MSLEVWCQTDVGLRRESNQDSFLIDRELGLYIVADGMGGHKGGEVASKMAAEKVREIVALKYRGLGRQYTVRQMLQEAVTHASHAIYDRSQRDADCNGMGTTLVACFAYENALFVANVGDSRAYMFSSPNLWQITEDHSLVNEQIRNGLLTEENAVHFGAKNVITRSVGYERDVECDVFERQIKKGELFLICSDGLSGMVSDEDISTAFRDLKPAELATFFIEAAKAGGGDDNITALVLFSKP